MVGVKGGDERVRVGPREVAVGGGGTRPARLGSSPPAINKGVKNLKVGHEREVGDKAVAGLDWLTLTVWEDYPFCMRWLTRLLGVRRWALQYSGHGGMGYRHCDDGPLGTKLYYDSPDGEGRCTVVLPGQAMGVVSLKALEGAMRELEGVGHQVTRLDVFIDGGEYSPNDCREAWEAGKVRTYARRDKWQWYEDEQGTTFYMGSRTSERFGRVYDRRGYTRFEVEFKRGRAEAVLGDLLGHEVEEWPVRIAGHIRDFVEFLEPWWDSVLGGGVRVWVSVGSAGEAMLEKTMLWLEKQVAPSLACVHEALGGDTVYVMGLVQRGRKRYNSRHRILLACQRRG